MSEKNRFDSVFKDRLRTTFFYLIGEEFNEKIEEYEEISFLPIELPKTIERKADFVLRTKLKEKEALFHLEVQTDEDPTMLNRMVTYLALLNEKFYDKDKEEPLLIKQIVLYLGRNDVIKSEMPRIRDFGYFIYEYKLINISDIPYQKFLENKETIIFAILGNFLGTQNVEVVNEIMEESRKYFANNADFNEFVVDLATLAELRSLAGAVVLNYNNHKSNTNMPIDIDITETYFYKQGEQRGKLEEKLAVAKVMLSDEMPIEQIIKFTGLSLEQIQDLQKD